MGMDNARRLVLQSVSRLVLQSVARRVTSKLLHSIGVGQHARSVLPSVHEVSIIDITVDVSVLTSPVKETNSETAFASVSIQQRCFACPMEPVVDKMGFVR